MRVQSCMQDRVSLLAFLLQCCHVISVMLTQNVTIYDKAAAAAVAAHRGHCCQQHHSTDDPQSTGCVAACAHPGLIVAHEQPAERTQVGTCACKGVTLARYDVCLH
jgi:hypothetical protein